MQKDLRWKILLIVAVTILFVWFLYPPNEKIKRGLDLEGGIHMVLRVKVSDAVRAEISDAAQRMKEQLRKEKIRFRRVSPLENENAFIVIGVSPQKQGEMNDLVKDWFPDFEARAGEDWVLALKESSRRAIETSAIRGAKETVENRINQYGLTEPIVQVQGGNRILVQIPGVDNPDRVKNLIQKTAFLEYRRVEGRGAPSEELLLQQFNGVLPPDTEIMVQEQEDPETGAVFPRYYCVHQSSILTGHDLRNARTGPDEHGFPAVHFTMKPDGSRRFKNATKEIIDSGVEGYIAIVLDGQVELAPVVEEVISTQSAVISGRYTQEEAEDLATMLRAGALPAGLEPLEERTVGPSLGHDSVRQGIMAAVLGLALVVAFMVIYYRLSGINAVVALCLNMVIVLGTMAYLQANLTLPGIAGIILTIGMAVDANVLIFERIREELRVGKTPKSAITGGFGKAFWTIFDANITTLIAAVFLFQFGTGPIKGFAVTLTIGILASMFTAIFVSRVIFDFVLGVGGRRATRISI